MKLFTAFAAFTLIAAPAVHAQWGGGAAQSAAAAYCASRASGNSHNKAEKDARWMLAGGMQGGFSSNMATILTSGRQMMQTTGYLIKSICPEYHPDSARGSLPKNSPKSTVSIDEAASTALSWGDQRSQPAATSTVDELGLTGNVLDKSMYEYSESP